jgi:hypothetical protein
MKCAEEKKKFQKFNYSFYWFCFWKKAKNMEEQSNEKEKKKKGIINFLSFYFFTNILNDALM